MTKEHIAAAPTPPVDAVQGEPVAFMWQHDETGRTGFVAADFDRAHWEHHNPRLHIVSPLYAASVAPAAAAEPSERTEQSAFEDWLELKCPSGDVESVQRQWLSSSAHEDWHDEQCNAATTPVHADRERAASLVASEGRVLVPREPTMEMEYAAMNLNRSLPEPRPLRVGYELHDAAILYKAMVAASAGEAQS